MPSSFGLSIFISTPGSGYPIEAYLITFLFSAVDGSLSTGERNPSTFSTIDVYGRKEPFQQTPM